MANNPSPRFFARRPTPPPLAQGEEPAATAQFLTRVMTALPAAVVVLDGSGAIRECNPAAQQLLGTALLGHYWRDVIVRAFSPEQGDGELALRDGRLVTLATTPLAGEPGQVILLQEVTASRRLQERLDHSRRLMEMGRMAANLAHQVRTPLASALLYASQLARPELPPQRREEFAQKTVARLRDLDRLVTDMLAFARGEVGEGVEIEPERLVEAVVEPVSEGAQLREVAITRRIESPALIRGNFVLLKTALQNLLGNALQAVDKGGRIELIVRQSGREALDLIVADDGPGIPEGLAERLFEPFQTTREGGTGLGLAVVRAIARAHHGEAWCEPAPGGGSRFGIRLPTINSRGE